MEDVYCANIIIGITSLSTIVNINERQMLLRVYKLPERSSEARNLPEA